MKIAFYSTFLIFLIVTISNAKGSIIEGYIYDEEDSVPVSYANIKLQYNYLGNISNNEGFFRLYLEIITDTDSIIISHVNYIPKKVSVASLLNNKSLNVLYLKVRSYMLNEVTILALSAEELLKKAIKKSVTSIKNPAFINAYYREFVKKNGDYVIFSDGRIDYYIPKEKNRKIRANVLESRAIKLSDSINEDKFDIEIISPIKVTKPIKRYNLSETEKFLDTLNFSNYNYELYVDSLEFGDFYLIKFSPVSDINEPLYSGEIFINRVSQLITSIEYEIDSAKIEFFKEINAIVVKGKLISSKGIIKFTNSSHKYHLEYVREHFGMKLYNNKNFNQVNEFISEVHVIDIKLGLDFTISKRDTYNKRSLYKNGNNYSYKYWEKNNYIQFSKEEEQIVMKLHNPRIIK